jgi:hypothetical protein
MERREIGATAFFLPVLLFGQQTSTREIMREKLEQAEHLLPALVLGEFEEIDKYATELERLAELQSWYVLPTPEYDEHSRAFRAAARAAALAGKNRNLEAAADAYASMIGRCVGCHEYLRRVREARPPGGKGDGGKRGRSWAPDEGHSGSPNGVE